MSDLNKPKALVLPLDYFRRPSRIQLWKGRLGAGVLGACFVGMALSWALSRETHLGASPGKVSAPHQAWDAACSACHDPFQAISSHTWAPPGMGHTTDPKCQSCHQGPD